MSAIYDDTIIPRRVADRTVTTAQLLALNATPISVIPAPGAGYANVLDAVILYLPAGTAYAGIAAGEDLAFKYTDGSGQECFSRVETTGFLDQTTAQMRYVTGASAAFAGVPTDALATPTANAAIVIQVLTGEITTGTSDLKLRLFYRVIPTTL